MINITLLLAILGSLLFIVYKPGINTELPLIFRYLFNNSLVIFVLFQYIHSVYNGN